MNLSQRKAWLLDLIRSMHSEGITLKPCFWNGTVCLALMTDDSMVLIDQYELAAILGTRLLDETG